MRRDKCRACPRRSELRGLCRKCYQAARYAMQTGKVTEQELVDAGAMAPAYNVAQSDFGDLLGDLLARRIKPCQGRKPNNQRRSA